MTGIAKRLACVVALGTVSACASPAQPSHEASFDVVWQTVNAAHFDPGFGGRDWRQIGDRYRASLAGAADDAQFAALANGMLFELGLSHLLVARQSDFARFLPELYAPGTAGLSVRIVDGRVLVSTVHAASSAADAGLRPGAVLEAVDGTTTTHLLAQAETRLIPPFNARNRRNVAVRLLWSRLYGTPGSEVRLTLTPVTGGRRELTLLRRARGDGRRHGDVLPPYFVTCEARVLVSGIGYIRFNHFAPPMDTQLPAALAGLGRTRGLIIDLRGNPGGYFDVVDGLASQLLREPRRLYDIELRGQVVPRMVATRPGGYAGPVAILVDHTTMSAAELFAGALQAAGRASIVGTATPGYMLAAQWKRLPNGLALMYAIGRPRLPDGTVLEHRGVLPDHAVALDADALAAGHDSQLDAAVALLADGATRAPAGAPAATRNGCGPAGRQRKL